MSQSRKTKKLTYNLSDRGRKATGQDRSNVDIGSMVAQINGAATQEMVSTGSLLGYYGHQVRQRFGMQPPETAFIDGKAIKLEPAIRTLEISAKSDGTVDHVEEFLDNDSGEFARRQYLSKTGGFSTAQHYRAVGNKLAVTGFYGFDYVMQPNYATNVGDGQLFDGLLLPCEPIDGVPMFDSMTDFEGMDLAQIMLAQALDQQVLSMYDSIHACVQMSQQNAQAYDQIGELLQENQRLIDKQARYAETRRKREAAGYDDIAGVTRSFDDVLRDAESFLTKDVIDRKKAIGESLADVGRGNWLGR
jgi:hypothetical protein